MKWPDACTAEHGDGCPPGLHVHQLRPVTTTWTVTAGACVVAADDRLLAVVTEPWLAERLLELAEQHGLVEVPDALNDWPAPEGAPLRTEAP